MIACCGFLLVHKTILVNSSFVGFIVEYILHLSLAEDEGDKIKSVALSTHGRRADAHKLSFVSSLIDIQMNIM